MMRFARRVGAAAPGRGGGQRHRRLRHGRQRGQGGVVDSGARERRRKGQERPHDLEPHGPRLLGVELGRKDSAALHGGDEGAVPVVGGCSDPLRVSLASRPLCSWCTKSSLDALEMCASAGLAAWSRTPFQPMCGTEYSGLVVKRATHPGMTPRPAMPGDSSLDSNRVCMPMHIPCGQHAGLKNFHGCS